MANVLQASCRKAIQGISIAYLAGELRQAKFLFDTKGGRDRSFAVLKSELPRVKSTAGREPDEENQ